MDDRITDTLACERQSKSSILIEAEGTIDELISHLGLCQSIMDSTDAQHDVAISLGEIQEKLYGLAAQISSNNQTEYIKKHDVDYLNNYISVYSRELPKINEFILIRGSFKACHIHVARSVARRLERVLVGMGTVDGIALKYVNRLSIALYTIARFINVKCESIEEEYWRNK